jgi:MoxR-like ATPase
VPMSVETQAQAIRSELRKAIAGQVEVIEQVLVAILANGHVLLEGVPGVAKTLLVRSLAHTLNLQYGRIQFTPDLMPSDVIGTNVFDPKTNDFRLRKGPIFVNILLADEINRTPPKTQAALLEAMEERRVTIDGDPQTLPPPFLVFATQNPIDFEGTYPLPEAQQDRFLMKVLVDYPSQESEIEVLQRHHAGFRPQSLEEAGITPIIDAEALAAMQAEVQKVTVEEKVFTYIYETVKATRNSNDLLVGGSPRAGIALLNCSKALAALRGRDFVIPDDVKMLALPVLRHRVLLRPEAEVEGLNADRVLNSILSAQVVPR